MPVVRKNRHVILTVEYTCSAMDVLAHPYVKTLENAEALSPNSKKQYLRHLQKVMQVSGATSLEQVIRTPIDVLRTIDAFQFSPSMKKSLVSSICALFKYNEEMRLKFPRERETWGDALRGINRVELDRVSSAEPTAREALNWVDWKTISAKERELAATEYGSDRHLLLALYVLMEPVRSDYGNIHVCIDEIPGKDLDNQGENYIMLSSTPGGSYLVLNRYKTSGKYGRFYRTVPDELVRIIAHNLEKHPREYLIIDSLGQSYENSNSFNKYVNRSLHELFQRRVTVNLLRHSFISSIDFNQATPRELMQISRNMMHSVGMQQLYRRQVDPLKVTLDESPGEPDRETLMAHMRCMLESEKKRVQHEMQGGTSEKDRKKKHKKKKKKKKDRSGGTPSDGRIVLI